MSVHTAAIPDRDHTAPERGVGHWARDFALVGAASSFLAPFLLTGDLLGWSTLVITTLAGGLSGALLGPLLRTALRSGLSATPWPLLALLMVAIGSAWGVVVGAAGATALVLDGDGVARAIGYPARVYTLFMAYAALAAALQLSWFGAAYARADQSRAPTWPLVLGACGTPFLGWAAVNALIPLLMHGPG